MPRFLVDEDMPRSLAPALRSAAEQAVDVRDFGLRGQPDGEVIAYARAHDQVLVTADLGFSNLLRFPPGSHPGIDVARLPNEMPTDDLVRIITSALSALASEDLEGNLVVVEEHRVRLRRKPART